MTAADFKNEPFKVSKKSYNSKGSKSRVENFSPNIEQPTHKFKGEVSSIGNQSDSQSPDKSNQWDTINKLGSDDVMIQTIGDQINLTNISDVNKQNSKHQDIEAGDKFVSHDERQTIASEYTQNTMPNTTNQVNSPGASQQHGYKTSIRGSFEAKNLIPIEEETKSPQSHYLKPNMGPNLS